MAVTDAKVRFIFEATHALTSGVGSGGPDNIVKHQLTESQALTPSTSVPASSAARFALTLASGTALIDLNAVTMAGGATATWTGIKVQALGIKVGTGASVMTVAVGTASGYGYAGSAWSQEVESGGSFLSFQNEAAPDVSTSARYILVSGTGSQSCEVMLLGG
jgi:hypothetical protein